MNQYLRNESVVFCKIDDPFGGYSNMARGFPIRYEGHGYLTNEHLYQSLRFPEFPEIQAEIRGNPSPMGAKMISKHHQKQRPSPVREDWNDVCIEIMRFCLRLKLQAHREKFGRLLLSSGDRAIVEESRRNRDDMWSARARGPNLLVGQNALGLLLMELREELRHIPTGQAFPLYIPVCLARP